MYSEPWGPIRADREFEFQNTWDIFGWAAMTLSLINAQIPETYEELNDMVSSGDNSEYDQ